MATKSQVGILTAILGNVAVNLSLNLQRYAKRRLVRMALYGIHPPSSTDFVLYAGMGLLIAGECTNFIAYGLAPASIVSPLGVLAVVSNCVIPPLLFDEAPSIHTTTGTTIALPGILLLIMSAPDDEDRFVLPLEPESRLFVSAAFITGIGLCCLSYTRLPHPIMLRVHSALAALMGSICVLCIKCSCLVVSRQGDLSAIAFLVLCTVISGILQAVVFVQSLRTYPLWQVVPHHFVFFTVFVGLGSAVILHEFDSSTWKSKVEFLTGCLLTIAGVSISARPHEEMSSANISVPKPRAKFYRKNYKKNKKNRNRKNRKALNSSLKSPVQSQNKFRPAPSPAFSVPRKYRRRSHGSQRNSVRSAPEINLSRSFDSWVSETSVTTEYLTVPTRSHPASSESVFSPLVLEEFPETVIDNKTYLLIPRRQFERGYGAL